MGFLKLKNYLMQKIAAECACGMDENECDCEECSGKAKSASEAWTR